MILAPGGGDLVAGIGFGRDRSSTIFHHPADEAAVRTVPKDIAKLLEALGDRPDKMLVEADSGVSANTVGALRNLTAWPGNLVVTTPRERYEESTVKISKAAAGA